MSAFTLLKLTNHTKSEDSKLSSVWLTTAIDGKSMFYEQSPTASRHLSLTLFVAIAEALKNGKADWASKLTKQIVFAALDGEHYDYIGSSSVLQDVKSGEFP